MSSGSFRTTRCRGKFKNDQLSRGHSHWGKKYWTFDRDTLLKSLWIVRRTSSLGCRTSCGRICLCCVSFMPVRSARAATARWTLIGRRFPPSLCSLTKRMRARPNAWRASRRGQMLPSSWWGREFLVSTLWLLAKVLHVEFWRDHDFIGSIYWYNYVFVHVIY